MTTTKTCVTTAGVVIACLLHASLTGGRARAQHYRYLRPEPTDKMPIPGLSEDPSSTFDPQPADIDQRALRDELGRDFEPDLMSAVKPSAQQPGGRLDGGGARYGGGKPGTRYAVAEIMKLFKRLQRKPRKSRKRERKMVHAWLERAAACPVRYRWKEMGARFWPPYVREGFCDAARSCSTPAGMTCKPVAHREITLLRWHCQGIAEERRYCLWIRVKYPLVSQCKCQC